MKKIFLIIILMTIIGCNSLPSVNKTDGIWLTDYDGINITKRISGVSFKEGVGQNKIKIKVSDAIKYQTIEGFGAALTDSSAWLLARSLSPANREDLLERLFSPQKAALSYIRLPIGASDFSIKPHTYNDGEEDPEQKNFSIAYDKDYIIPIILQIKKINPNLKIIASPWSPPAWMKTSKQLNGGSLRPEYYRSYALYLLKFLLQYRARGIHIDAVTVQNEPNYQTRNYPSMLMSPGEQTKMVRLLGPLFEKHQVTTKIFVWDHNWDRLNDVLSILNDKEASPYIAGTAWHAYEGNANIQAKVYKKFPNKKIYFTEVTGMQAYTDFDHNLYWSVKNILIDGLRNWASVILYWNILLDDSHGPNIMPLTVDDTEVLRGLVQYDRRRREIQLQTELHAISHFSRFIKVGARRIYSETFSNSKIMQISKNQTAKGIPYTVAFQNPDGKILLVVLNTGFKQNLDFDIVWHNKHIPLSLERESVLSIRW